MLLSRVTIGALVAALGLALTGAGRARADSLVSLPESDYVKDARNPQQRPLPTEIRHVAYPAIGCASLVAPGGELAPVVWLADGGRTGDWEARIRTRDAFVQTIPLPFLRATYDAATETYRLAFEVPWTAPEDVYDLEIRSASLPGGAETQPNAARVLRPRAELEIAHVADTQIRDPITRYPQKFEQLLEELRLRDPAFVLYSGDLNFGADYEKEYPENRAILRAGGLAMFAAPGNHDGYSWLLSATDALYDGLHIWRRTIGPTYYAMRWGGIRFVAANSYGGPTERRNSYTFLNHNSGGDMEPAQLAWIDAQGREATAAGEEAVLFLHHNPHPQRSLTPNVPGYPWDVRLVGAAQGVWNGQWSRDELTRILGDHPAFRWVLAGHENFDEHLVGTLGSGASAHDVHYVTTTSPSNGGSPREGYRWIRVRNGRLDEMDYQPAQPSVPFPLGGSYAVTWFDPNDGQRGLVRVRVESILERPTDVTLRVFLRPNARGYRTSAGAIREIGVADAGVWVAYLRLTVPAQGAVPAEISPDAAGAGARPAVLGGGGPAGPATAAAAGGVGGGGGGCAAGPQEGTASIATWALVIALLAALHYAART